MQDEPERDDREAVERNANADPHLSSLLHTTDEAKTGVRPDDGNLASNDQAPIAWRELLTVLVLVVLSDLTIYRGHGLAGYALLFATAPILFWIGSYRPQTGFVTWLVGLMPIALAAKMLWCGAAWYVAVGFALLAAFSACLAGRVPYVFAVLELASSLVRRGYQGLNHYGRNLRVPWLRLPWLNVLMPLAALIVFGFVFILANIVRPRSG